MIFRISKPDFASNFQFWKKSRSERLLIMGDDSTVGLKVLIEGEKNKGDYNG